MNCTATLLHAQNYNFPVTPDEIASTFRSNVKNTGTAAVEDLQAIVWDGDNPGMAVYDFSAMRGTELDFANGSNVVDPDVVIDPVTGNTIMVVYELQRSAGVDIVYEYFEYNQGTNTIIHLAGPNTLSTGTRNEHPNVDIAPDGVPVVVWDDNDLNQIAATVGDPLSWLSTSYAPQYDASQSMGCLPFTADDFQSPDVSIYYDLSKSDYQISCAFRVIENGATVNHILVSQFSLFDVLVSNQPCQIDNIDAQPIFTCELADPRIATMYPYSPADERVYNLVWLRDFQTGTSQNEICSRTRFWLGGGLQPTTVLNSTTAPDLRDFYNAKPITTIGGDVFVNAWDYDDQFAGVVQGREEQLLRYLHLDGSIVWPTEFTVVPDNAGASNDYSILSIDGRYSGYVYYAFWNQTTDEIQTKRSFPQNWNLRRAGPEIFEARLADSESTRSNVFPNPASMKLYVSSDEKSVQYQLINVQGALQKLRFEHISSELQVADVDHLAAGVYYLIWTSNSKTFREKVVIFR